MTRFFLEKLADAALDEQTGVLVGPLRSALEVLMRQVAELDLRLEELGGREPVIQRLMTVPGAGLIVRITLRLSGLSRP